MDTIPVTLIVKAPNQQFEDQTIKCELSWTIKRLKGYLSEVYPCKPSTEEQKLIYSGQLLNDTVVLKDVLRQYEGQETHTVHLVFTPKMNPHGSDAGSGEGAKKGAQDNSRTTLESEGLRQRRALGGDQVPMAEASAMPGVNAAAQDAHVGQFGGMPQPGNFLVAQQLAYQQWLQQAYVDYMNQYVSLMSRPGAQAAYQPPAFVPPAADQAPAAEAAPEPVAEAPQPRFPNLVRDEGPEQRDWLDIFYAFSRLMVLITLVYFYSSPTRCLIVVAIGILIYCYHTGVFRHMGGGAEANNNRAPLEPRPPVINNNNNNNTDAEDEASDAVVRDETNRTPVIAFLRTFVLSFFASLIPEAAAL
ncbi:homocysteine-responsive endoplasmic reticulum-resident ubiquitin-like domain member 2 protein [Phlebotomus argentipes]|uniref:homocysteine-responsive endoplasmic reticulum-resident ubiquitin-like domain member 2 protein n=1 Tax=Phlebotomus argentipes TaxID=94469 RepID=UPI0028933446|nr:homocysteine-responsive endoplasmic reticulum-resident ubiquitin-like domain member 2 protein [Phlebotomus argentipes]